MTTNQNPATIYSAGLLGFVSRMSPRRKCQLSLLIVLTLAGAIAEILAIGAVLPFLRLIISPQAVFEDPHLIGLRTFFGWRRAADLVMPAALLLVSCAVSSAFIRLLLVWASQKFTYRLGYDMDISLFRVLLYRRYIDHVNDSSSRILSAFDKINVLSNSLLLTVISGVSSATVSFFIIIFLVWIIPFYTFVSVAIILLVYIGFIFWMRPALKRASETRAYLATVRIKTIGEAIGGTRDTILNQTQDFHEQRFTRIDDEFRRAGAYAAIMTAIPRYVIEGIIVALIGIIAIFIAGRPGESFAEIPVLGALVLGAQRILPLLQASYQGVVQYIATRRSLNDVLNILADPISISPIPINNAEPLFRREIALSGIGFHYDNGAMALTDIDLTIAAGQRVGLVGRTGSGKSTLVDVLMGLLEPSTGAILLDGVVLTTDRVSHWQAQIAHVPQTIFLADDSLAANISLGDAIDQNRIENAARGAHIHDFIVSLPKGYETRVGERGIHLSGGQRQRIGIARALYRRADVLVFDEATSALDDETETSVMASVDSLEGNLTVIMIAHRLSTLRNCDVIYRLENGRIVERGDYQMVVGEVGTAF